MSRFYPVRAFLQRGSNRLVIAGLALGLAWHGLSALTLVGVAIFLVLEYVVHRFLLHAPLAPVRFVAQLQSRIHYGHHEQPENLDLVFLPAPLIAVLTGLHFWLYHALTGSVDASVALVTGNLAGLLYYEWVHFIAHVPATPMTAWGRWIKKLHLLHHFKNEHHWLGVTNPLGDVLLGTFGTAEDVPTSGTARSRPVPL